MAFGSIVTASILTRLGAEDFVGGTTGVVLASASSVAHVQSDISWESGNTGIGTVSFYASVGSGAFSATTEWDDIPFQSFSVSSNTNPNQFATVINGVYAWRAGVFNSSNSTIMLKLSYRID